ARTPAGRSTGSCGCATSRRTTSRACARPPRSRSEERRVGKEGEQGAERLHGHKNGQEGARTEPDLDRTPRQVRDQRSTTAAEETVQAGEGRGLEARHVAVGVDVDELGFFFQAEDGIRDA